MIASQRAETEVVAETEVRETDTSANNRLSAAGESVGLVILNGNIQSDPVQRKQF